MDGVPPTAGHLLNPEFSSESFRIHKFKVREHAWPRLGVLGPAYLASRVT
jgi:hypothetical protein